MPQVLEDMSSSIVNRYDDDVRTTFGVVLANCRQKQGWTQLETADKLHVSRSLYKKIEQGTARPQPRFAADCDELFDVPDVFAELQREAMRRAHPPWFAPKVDLEQTSDGWTEWEPRTVPSMFQTPRFAYAIARANLPCAVPSAIESTVDARLARQEVLSRDNPPKLQMIIPESALRQAVGSADVMREQLGRLIELGESPHVILQVLPFTCADAPGASGPLVLFEREGQPPVAYAEGYGGGRVIDAPSELADVIMTLNVIKSCALSPRDSCALTREIQKCCW